MKWFGSKSVRYALATAGGKDATLALHHARRDGLDVSAACTLFDSETRRIRIHGIPVDLVEAQAAVLGLELISVATRPENFEATFLELMRTLRSRGIGGVVFGNLHLNDVRAWYEERTHAAGLRHVEPLWGQRPGEVVREVIASGFRATIVSVSAESGRAEWLGRELDFDRVGELEAAGIDPCGEHGEFHTFVWDGPEFRQPLSIRVEGSREEDGHLLADVEWDEPRGGSPNPND